MSAPKRFSPTKAERDAIVGRSGVIGQLNEQFAQIQKAMAEQKAALAGYAVEASERVGAKVQWSAQDGQWVEVAEPEKAEEA